MELDHPNVISILEYIAGKHESVYAYLNTWRRLIVVCVASSKGHIVLHFLLSSKDAVWKIKHSYLLLFLFHSTFQKVKIAFLHNSITLLYMGVSNHSNIYIRSTTME